MLIQDYFQIACNIADVVFADKKDKGDRPYMMHLRRVSENAMKYYRGAPEYEYHLKIIGLLHDLIEDCPEWELSHLHAVFKSDIISDAMLRLTHKEGESYDLYIEGIKNNSFAVAVKLADLEDNMNLARLKVITDEDIERVKKYHAAFTYLKAYAKL